MLLSVGAATGELVFLLPKSFQSYTSGAITAWRINMLPFPPLVSRELILKRLWFCFFFFFLASPVFMLTLILHVSGRSACLLSGVINRARPRRRRAEDNWLLKITGLSPSSWGDHAWQVKTDSYRPFLHRPALSVCSFIHPPSLLRKQVCVCVCVSACIH